MSEGVKMRSASLMLVVVLAGCANSGPDLSTRQGFANALGREYCEAVAECCGRDMPNPDVCDFSVNFYEGFVNDASVEYVPDRASIYFDQAVAGFARCELSLLNMPLRGLISEGGSCGANLTTQIYGCAPGLLCTAEGDTLVCRTGSPASGSAWTDITESCGS